MEGQRGINDMYHRLRQVYLTHTLMINEHLTYNCVRLIHLVGALMKNIKRSHLNKLSRPFSTRKPAMGTVNTTRLVDAVPLLKHKINTTHISWVIKLIYFIL